MENFDKTRDHDKTRCWQWMPKLSVLKRHAFTANRYKPEILHSSNDGLLVMVKDLWFLGLKIKLLTKLGNNAKVYKVQVGEECQLKQRALQCRNGNTPPSLLVN
ncbi:hypothetical protein GQX74_014428 [Glossina fuscipes]|nr:hypothetical protein GQX74_014428 [Glossina fuscipes]